MRFVLVGDILCQRCHHSHMRIRTGHTALLHDCTSYQLFVVAAVGHIEVLELWIEDSHTGDQKSGGRLERSRHTDPLGKYLTVAVLPGHVRHGQQTLWEMRLRKYRIHLVELGSPVAVEYILVVRDGHIACSCTGRHHIQHLLESLLRIVGQ